MYEMFYKTAHNRECDESGAHKMIKCMVMILKEITANKRGLENIQNPPSLPMEGNVNSEGRRGVQKVAISEG